MEHSWWAQPCCGRGIAAVHGTHINPLHLGTRPACPQVPGATTYMGCVGADHYAEELKKVASKDGVKVRIVTRPA